MMKLEDLLAHVRRVGWDIVSFKVVYVDGGNTIPPYLLEEYSVINFLARKFSLFARKTFDKRHYMSNRFWEIVL